MAITISGSGITSANIADGAIVDGDINSNARIGSAKLTGVQTSLVAGTHYLTPTGNGNALTSAGIIKQYKVTSAPAQVSLTVAGNSAATGGTYVGCQITMTPQDINSWFKVHWDTICDDSGGSANTGAGGVGIQLSVHTPSTGWVRKRDSGSHSFYYNAMADEYFRPAMDTVVKAMNTELHTFRIYMDTHTGVYYRINSVIGNDYRIDGWHNNHFEVTEVNGTNFNSGNYTG
jgi:hypothetical protein